MEEQTHHIWIKITVSDTRYQFESTAIEAEAHLELPTTLLHQLNFGSFVNSMIERAVDQHKESEAESSEEVSESSEEVSES